MRRLGFLLVAAFLTGLAVRPASAADDLCRSLLVPSEYGLACRPGEVSPEAAAAAAVEPVEGVFAPLSRLTVRRLREPVEDPEDWLRRQVAFDLSGLGRYVQGAVTSVDSPFRGTEIAGALMELAGEVEALGRLPLEGCGRTTPEVDGTEIEELRCLYQLGPLRAHAVVGLLEKSGETYAFEVRTMNEERLRHLLAIVNSFAAS